jgi:hypothetical protein
MRPTQFHQNSYSLWPILAVVMRRIPVYRPPIEQVQALFVLSLTTRAVRCLARRDNLCLQFGGQVGSLTI